MPMVSFQAWLDRVGEAFFNEDYAAYRRAVALPLTVATVSGAHVVSEEPALRMGFDAWVSMMRGMRIDAMIRTARDVEFLGPELIVGRYETELLSGARRVVEPFASSMQLRRDAQGAWRCFSVTSGMQTGASWPIDRT